MFKGFPKSQVLIVSVQNRKETADLKTIKKYFVFFVVWRGSFEPSTAPFRLERERVQTDTIKTGFYKIKNIYFLVG